MPSIRLALAQVNPAVGDLTGNAHLVRQRARAAHEAGATLVAFPEMVLTGYPVEDLVFRESFVAASQAALADLARSLDADGLGDLPVIVGYLDADGPLLPVAGGADTGPRNAAAVIQGGRVLATYFKHHLPNYGVFDEDRYFVSGGHLPVVRLQGETGTIDAAVVICEDLWGGGGPITAARDAGAGLVIVINGSPYERNKDDVRLELCRQRAAEARATLAYVNLVGGQDDLVFDGDSLVVSASGEVLARAGQFSEELLLVDLEIAEAGAAGPVDSILRVERVEATVPSPRGAAPVRRIADRTSDEAEIWAALVTGTRDYVRKNGFRSVVLGLSGGIDSAVVATIAADAIGAANVVGVSLPSAYSSEHSRSDAADLAERQGLDFRTVPIAHMVDAFESALGLTGLAAENLQARVRGVILMGLSNQEGHLVLTTGNKSELAVGYSTLYGDSVGGFNPIKDVFKTTVWKLARWRNADAEKRGEKPPIPEASITKPPSAELRPGQLDTDSLPDYDELDAILEGYVDGDASRRELIAAGHDAATVDRVIRLVDLAEYKRRQSAPGPKTSLKAFGRDRRLPLTNLWREHG